MDAKLGLSHKRRTWTDGDREQGAKENIYTLQLSTINTKMCIQFNKGFSVHMTRNGSWFRTNIL
jgi:hypothetical protein